MKRTLTMLILVMMTFTLSACETMKGFGRDVEDAGEWVQEKAK